MSVDLRDFDRQMKRLEKELDRKFAGFVTELVEELHERILMGTPVWSGEAIVNWQVSLDMPTSGELEAVESPDTWRSTQKPLATPIPHPREDRRSANAAKARLSRQSLRTAWAQPYRSYYITNNTEQIVGLEMGRLPEGPEFTPRSPDGVVQKSIDEMELDPQWQL